jgi:hypothetical protein
VDPGVLKESVEEEWPEGVGDAMLKIQKLSE